MLMQIPGLCTLKGLGTGNVRNQCAGRLPHYCQPRGTHLGLMQLWGLCKLMWGLGKGNLRGEGKEEMNADQIDFYPQ
jgi:hypothetical protein